MPIISDTNLQKSVAQFLDRVSSGSTPIVITRKNKKSVIIPLQEFTSLQETAHLLGTEKNRRHLRKSLGELEAGTVVRVVV